VAAVIIGPTGGRAIGSPTNDPINKDPIERQAKRLR